MSRLKVDEIIDVMETGSPEFPKSLTVAGKPVPVEVATKAEGISIASSLPDGSVVRVRADESASPAGVSVSYTVASGLLTDPVADDINRQMGARIDNIAALRLYGPPMHGAQAIVASYYSGWAATALGPSGGGRFIWDAASTDADNGGSIIAVTGISTGRWKRPRQDTVLAEEFGMIGDAGATDNYSLLQAAINHISTTGGGVLQFRAATYGYLTRPDIKTGVTLRGAGYSTILKNYSTGDSTALGIPNANFWGVEDLILAGNRDNSTSGDGIRFVHTVSLADCRSSIRNVQIQDIQGDGVSQLQETTVSSLIIENFRITRCNGYGIRAFFLNDVKGTNWDVSYCKNSGIRIIAANVNVVNCKVFACRVPTFTGLSATNIPPSASTEAADTGAVILAGPAHQWDGLEIQENGSIGLQLGESGFGLYNSEVNCVIDGNGGYVDGVDNTTASNYRRPGILAVNYYQVAVNASIDDFRARVGYPRQSTGFKISTAPTFNSASTLLRGEWYKITDNSGGADFTNLQVGISAPSNAVGRVFQARTLGFGNPAPASWGTGSLAAVNDRLALKFSVSSQYDMDNGTGRGYSLAGDGGNSNIIVNGVDVSVYNGIKFANGIGSSDSATLDYYIEGTATPKAAGTTAAGTATYTSQSLRYTRIGRMVQGAGRVTYSGHTGTGSIKISGMPFAHSASGAGLTPVNVYSVSGLAYVGTLTGYVQGSDLFIRQVSESGVGSSVTIPVSADIYFSFVYEAA